MKWAATINVISRFDDRVSLPSNILDQNPIYINIKRATKNGYPLKVEVTGVEPVSSQGTMTLTSHMLSTNYYLSTICKVIAQISFAP